MHLKSLNLKGFKSFADRSVLSFEPGITAIVGPNGSGKSNISDSVLWVLGERNARNLRGQAMEDVVFAGSSARKPVGVAEVDLVLDNSDGTLPIDFNEVVITRRMYRNGESEYLINKSMVRRMDVLDILHDTGLGSGTHSIISQGSLDSILHSKPEDRRMLIEEAAGVLKHKQRKLKSERKLEQMDNHLMRVKDVAAEVERQLKPLERKAKRAQAYQGLADELAELSLALAVDDLRFLQEAWEKATKSEQHLLNELETMRCAIKAAEEAMQSLTEQIQAGGMSASDVAQKYRRVQSILERFDATVLLLQEKKRAASSYETEIHLVLETNALKTVQATQAHMQALQQFKQAATGQNDAENLLADLEKEQAWLRAKLAKLEEKLETSLRFEQNLSQDIELTRLTQVENQELLSNSKAHEKLILGHSKELEIQRERAEKDHAAQVLQLEGFGQELVLLEKEEQEARELVARSFSERENRQHTVEDLRGQLALLSAEIKGIEEVERAVDAASPARAWLLENKIQFGAEVTALSHIISAPVGLELLVEWLLGDDIRALLVDDMAQAQNITDALRKENAVGEVVLFSRANACRKASEAPHKAIPLTTLLTYPPEYEQLLESLLGDVYLCNDSAELFSAHRDISTDCRFVTRDGVMVTGQGRVCVGMSCQDAEGVLVRHKRLEFLRGEEKQGQLKFSEAITAKEKADQDLQKAQTKSLALSQQLARRRGGYVAFQEELKRGEEKLISLRREHEDLNLQREEVQSALASAQPASVEVAKKMFDLQTKLEEAKKISVLTQAEKEPLQRQNKELNDRVSNVRLERATLVERASYAEKMLKTNEDEATNLRLERQMSLEVLVRKLIVKDRIEPILQIFEDLTGTARRWIYGLEEEMSQAQNLSSGLHTSVNEARLQSKAAHDAFDEVNDKLSAARIEKGKLEIQVESAINTIVHDCKKPLEAVLDLPRLGNRQATEELAFKLRRRIANMGTINPDAASEYEELKTRYDYMARQLDDMHSARRALAKIVRIIDARMKKDFLTTFEQVSLNFKEIFTILFPGGSGELFLVDPQNPETSGVEVTAQPRGKRITKMMLMSGGEKSLTALTLLFAVYRTRATPFYILDEVEAALDDTNLRRLCTYFDSLRPSTQLILITHQRRTMEIADVLYGISMQADGVTQVVSQKLDRALQYAEG